MGREKIKVRSIFLWAVLVIILVVALVNIYKLKAENTLIKEDMETKIDENVQIAADTLNAEFENEKTSAYENLELVYMYSPYFYYELRWIADNQAESGAIYINAMTEGGSLDVNPYFSCRAARALLLDDYYIPKVSAYLNWHTSKVIETNGLVTNYRYNSDEETLISTGKYDSTDSYLAEYLMLLCEYCNAGGTVSDISNYEQAVEISVNYLESLMKNGLTVTKIDSDDIYFMDNVEVYYALKLISETFPDKSYGIKAKTLSETSYSRIIEEFYNEEDNSFKTGIFASSGETMEFDDTRLYPCGIAQLYAVIYDLGLSDEKKKNLYDKFCEKYSWTNVTDKSGTFDYPMIAVAALEVGDIERARAYIDSFENAYQNDRTYPFYVGAAGWVAIAEKKLINNYDSYVEDFFD